MKNAINNTTITGSNHMNILNKTTAIKIAHITKIKSLSSM